jgi:transcriptional antiterminator NusG
LGYRFWYDVAHCENNTFRLINVEEQKSKQWYVVHAYSGYESFVMREIKLRADHHGIQGKIGDIVVPSEEVVEMRAGQKRKSTRKFFPGYVLVNMVMDDETWHMIRKIPRVLGFIGGTSQTPTPISDKEARAILQRVEDGVTKPKPKILFEPGEVVRVKEGPFVDFNGVVEEVNYEKSRLRVAVLIFGRSTPVELEFSQVEKS